MKLSERTVLEHVVLNIEIERSRVKILTAGGRDPDVC